MEFYGNREQVHLTELKKLTLRYNIISASRLLMVISFLILGYYSLSAKNPTLLLCCMAFCVVEFLLLMMRHATIQDKKLRAEALITINRNETEYLSGRGIPFADGSDFIDYNHPYSHDLDIFGHRSLFQNLNRTQTYKGNERLATLIKKALPNHNILPNQEAIKELAVNPELRQEIMALGMIKKDSREIYNRLIDWAKSDTGKTNRFTILLSFAGPAAFIASFIYYVITGNDTAGSVAGWLFAFNLLFTLMHLKAIRAEMKHIADIDEIIHHYGLIIEQIENATFKSEKLKALQDSLAYRNKKASRYIKWLAVLFARLDSSNNIFGAILFSGALVFHYHALRALWKWKKWHSVNIAVWLDIIAEMEALGSFANLYYNNPDFVFPELNTEYKIEFSNLAHPLLKKKKRIGNTINFDQGFIILTGSNMSGKSTFLRSLGVNMVLAGAGAPVCADNANINPLPVLVSMRMSDSLTDSESYFFAEVKRLKYIMDELQENRALVLLDEILKGTNSEDKHTGTVKVIRKLLSNKAMGAIATHDIEVCDLATEYPGQLVNRCFEVQIVNNDLYFDYLLREGICRNKSATFLMEKMGIV